MVDDAPSDERRLYKALQQVADVLLPLEQKLRERVYATVGTFFGYKAAYADSPCTSRSTRGSVAP